MNVWTVTIGEPVPVDDGRRDRLHRAGYLSHYLAEHGHPTTWWTSTFDHFRKEHWFPDDRTMEPSPDLQIRLLNGGGYRSNVSWARMRDHRRIAAKFAHQAREFSAPDIILASLPTLELCTEAVRYGQERSVPVVLDMRDMWPDIFVDTAPRPVRPLARFLLQPLFRAARIACENASAIIGVTDAFVEWGLQRGQRTKTEWDQSFPFGYASRPPAAEQIATAEHFWDQLGITAQRTPWVACFFGTFGRQLDIVTLIQAARECQRRKLPFHFVLCGTGDRWEELHQLAQGLSNVTLPGWVDAAAIHVLMRRSKVGLDPLPDRYDFLSNINNKAVEYFSAGLPVISSPAQGVLADLLTDSGAGRSHAQGDVAGLCRLLEESHLEPARVTEMSRQSSRLFRSRFSAEIVYGGLMHYLENMVADHSARQPTRRMLVA